MIERVDPKTAVRETTDEPTGRKPETTDERAGEKPEPTKEPSTLVMRCDCAS